MIVYFLLLQTLAVIVALVLSYTSLTTRGRHSAGDRLVRPWV